MKNFFIELVEEYGKPIAVKDADTWATVQAVGNYEAQYKNGELWTFNGCLYYLSHLELDMAELKAVNELYKGAETI